MKEPTEREILLEILKNQKQMEAGIEEINSKLIKLIDELRLSAIIAEC